MPTTLNFDQIVGEILQNLLHEAANLAPGGIGKVLHLIIDKLIVPDIIDGWSKTSYGRLQKIRGAHRKDDR
jgi:hypothetical protein